MLFTAIRILLGQIEKLTMLPHWLISAICCIFCVLHGTVVLLFGQTIIQAVIQTIGSIGINCIHSGHNRVLPTRILPLYPLQVRYWVALWYFIDLFLTVGD